MICRICFNYLKLFFILSISFFYIIKFKIIFIISSSEEIHLLYEKNYYNNKYLPLKEKPLNLNDSLINKEKFEIFKLLSKNSSKNITFINTIFFTDDCKFGNCIVSLNKLLFYCEIIQCKSIILDKDVFWFIKNKINIFNYNFTIEVGDKMNNNNSYSLYYNSSDIFYSFFFIKPEIRINLIRNEIINNLKKVIADKQDLYIHIRSGDIFFNPHPSYAQPPLCFYKKILNNNIFKKVYLITQNKNNPLIEKLINEYPNILYNQNSIKDDISFLINAYNIVASISSFLISIVEINYNLKLLWDYNIYKKSEKILAYHYDFYKFPNNFIIFRMEPSSYYQKTMYKWKNSKKQRKLMKKEKCINNFRIIYK